MENKKSIRQTHLQYYTEHEISPVSYDMSSIEAHLERRQSLYDKLGLTSVALKGSNVLEIAAGTGHNSLYISSRLPSSLTLLEPNPTALSMIADTYKMYGKNYLLPEIVPLMLENYYPKKKFDFVICENWLGVSEHELSLLNKISNFLDKDGIILITAVAPIGFVPNLIRRHLSNFFVKDKLNFINHTQTLAYAFENHLKTLDSMTRNSVDWVQDNMINPAYYGLCLSIPRILREFEGRFNVLNVYPDFVEDWRWFKQLYGINRISNTHYLSEYWKKNHNFLDANQLPYLNMPEYNKQLEAMAYKLLTAIKFCEDAISSGEEVTAAACDVVNLLNEFILLIPDQSSYSKKGLIEAMETLKSIDNITVEKVRNMKYFSHLFGRETSYISLQKII